MTSLQERLFVTFPIEAAIANGIGASFRAVLTAGGAALVIFGALGTVDFPTKGTASLRAGSG